MSEWNGPAKRGAMREVKARKRIDAEVRDELLEDDSPKRRRNKGIVIVAPPIVLEAAGDVAG